MERIIIDLKETDTKSYSDANFIQVEAKEQFLKLIKKFIDISSDSINNSNYSFKHSIHEIRRVHNTILVNAKRGMGKTSFALSLVNYLPDTICPLRIIDPTLIETKEHVLILLITLMKEKIEEHIRCNKCDISDSSYRSWKESLKKLAGGLSMLDEVGSDHLKDNLWDSPELVLEKGLSNTKHGYKLEENFHKFVAESLKFLGKKAFFVVLDDIDTSVDKGIVILEVLRKYVTTPQIITVLLGDIELYSTLVRQIQWERIDSKKILKDYEFNIDGKKYVYLSQIEHLEDQYLVKILKPENRIHLKTLFELMCNIAILRAKDQSQNPDALEEYFAKMVKTLFLSTGYISLYEQTILNQSTRSIIQLFKAFDECNEILSNEFVKKFQSVFYTTLYKQLYNYHLLEPNSFGFMSRLGRYVILNPSINRDANLELLPESTASLSNNLSYIYLNLQFNAIVKQQEYLSYFIKVGYALEQYNYAEPKGSNHQAFFNHIGLDSTEPNARIARRLLTTFKIDNNKIRKPYFEFGNLSFNQEQQKLIKDNPIFPLVFSNVYNPVGGNLGFLSFWNLLGVLADLTQASSKEEALNILHKNQMIRNYYLYSQTQTFSIIESEAEDKVEFNGKNEIFNKLAEWALKIKNIEKIPLYVLAKIWVRTVYTIREIDSRDVNKKKSYLEIFQLYMSAFLNAVFVQVELYKLEKAYYRCSDAKTQTNEEIKNLLNVKNPNTDIRFFAEKLYTYKTNANENKYYIDEDGRKLPTKKDTPWGVKLYRKIKDEQNEVRFEPIEEKPEDLFEFLYICPLFSNISDHLDFIKDLKFEDKDSKNVKTIDDFRLLTKEQRLAEITRAYSEADNELKKAIDSYVTQDASERQRIVDEFRKYVYKLGYKKGFNKWMMEEFLGLR